MKTDREEKSVREREREEVTGRAEEVKHIANEREEIGRSEMRSEKVRKGSVVLFGSCVAETPTGRCYGRNVLFGPSRPTPRPVPPPRESSGSRTQSEFWWRAHPRFISRGIVWLGRVFRKEGRLLRERSCSDADFLEESRRSLSRVQLCDCRPSERKDSLAMGIMVLRIENKCDCSIVVESIERN